ncbi:hypothetical protein LIA77_01539 [Sarocladium implicatum]|nr:hypothetical protein LIA77_01539 [Sarocladium implicatum]
MLTTRLSIPNVSATAHTKDSSSVCSFVLDKGLRFSYTQEIHGLGDFRFASHPLTSRRTEQGFPVHLRTCTEYPPRPRLLAHHALLCSMRALAVMIVVFSGGRGNGLEVYFGLKSKSPPCVPGRRDIQTLFVDVSFP